MRTVAILLASIVLAGCLNRHVNGSTLRNECPGDMYVVVDNRTTQTYDVMYGEETIGRVSPNQSARIRVPKPTNARVSLKEVEMPLTQARGGRARPSQPRIVCNPAT